MLMTPEYTETVFTVNGHYTDLDVPRTLVGGDYAGMDFPSNLKRLRISAGLTQAALAEKLEVSQPSIQRWENGKREPSYADLFAIADALKLPVGELFSDGIEAAGADTQPGIMGRDEAFAWFLQRNGIESPAWGAVEWPLDQGLF